MKLQVILSEWERLKLSRGCEKADFYHESQLVTPLLEKKCF